MLFVTCLGRGDEDRVRVTVYTLFASSISNGPDTGTIASSGVRVLGKHR